ncbi:MAG: phosphomannomutase/phosphoglucomutase [Polyangiales bacterium]
MTLQVPANIFREYDVRGIADQHLTDELMRALGRAFALTLADGDSGKVQKRTVALARDCRLSSDRIHAALRDGLLEAGLDIIDVGVGPTPMLYFAVATLDVAGGLMITGSHNPAPENGVKMLRKEGSIFGAEIQRLRERIVRGESGAGPRGSLREHDVKPAYVQYMKDNLQIPRGADGIVDIKLVIDAGNGSGGPLGLRSMEALGLRPVALYCEMDGRFPNHHPDPTQPENLTALIAKVKETGARVGIAYDGDADRLGAVDADGTIVWGDRLLTLFARDILRTEPGAKILGEVKCSQTLYDDIAKHGGVPILWKTGHSLIKTKMKEEHALLAGEMSGHLFFKHRYFGYDDAIYASLRLLEILVRTGKTIGELLADLPKTFVTPEIRVDSDDTVKFQIVDRVRDKFRAELGRDKVIDIDGARILFEHGWGLVRASNTQPALVVRFEADTEARRDQYRARVEGEIAAAKAALAAT